MDEMKPFDKKDDELPSILNSKLNLGESKPLEKDSNSYHKEERRLSSQAQFETDTSEYSSSAESDESDDDTQGTSIKVNGRNANNKIITNADNAKVVNNIDILQHVFNSTNTGQTLGNVFIEKSNGVHIGNIINVTGTINITQSAPSNTNQNENSENSTNRTKSSRSKCETSATASSTSRSCEHDHIPATRQSSQHDDVEEVEREEVNRTDAFIGNIERAIDGNVLKIIGRKMWLAQRPFEPYEFISGPAKYVVISHTASEEGTTQAENVFLVRHIQCFHIESLRWNDIAYNFLIGSDGNVYEGRGWRVVGAHTYGYNKKSMGISFIGCFMRDRPPDISLKACRLLIKRGIEEGSIASDYKLIAHCQCSPTESPGRILFEEIQKWPHFCSNPTE